MPVIGQPLTHMRLGPVKRIHPSRHSNPRSPFVGQVRPHRLAVPPGVPDNGRDRPSPHSQRVNLHVFLLCQQQDGFLSGLWASLLTDSLVRGTEYLVSPLEGGNLSDQN